MTTQRPTDAITARFLRPLSESTFEEPRARAGRSIVVVIAALAILMMMVV